MNRVQAVARSLVRDRFAVEISGLLADAGVRSVLLKGAAVAGWLYDDGALRWYSDTDLLVAPGDFDRAEEALREAGFTRPKPGWSPLEEPRHARAWVRDGEVVDLHRSLWGVGVDAGTAWARLSDGTEVLRLGGGRVEALGRPARALHVALHAAQNGEGEPKSRDDLARAAQRVPIGTWQEAAALARALQAEDALAAGLRLDPTTAALCDELGLTAPPRLAVALRAAQAGRPVVGLAEAMTAPGWAAKCRQAARRVVPTPAWLRERYPVASRGRAGLAAAYGWRALSVAAQLPAAVKGVVQARRRSR